MSPGCGFSAFWRRCFAAALLLAATAFVGVGVVPHAHVQDGVEDCAVCKAAHVVATIDSTAGARRAIDHPSGRVSAVRATIASVPLPRTHAPRGPPAR